MESFVDLSYRGLSLGRRVKLTQVRPTSGYLETPAPMPVGTSINIATDEGLSIDAIVTAIHEQVGGSDRPPGMTVTPALAGAASDWWGQRATLPAEEPAAPPPAAVAAPAPAQATPPPTPVISRTPAQLNVDPLLASIAAASETVAATAEVNDGKTQVMAVVADPDEPPGGRTIAMPVVTDPDAPQVPAPPIVPEHAPTHDAATHAIVDDGKRTTVMEVVDPAALGLTDETSEPAERKSSPNVSTGSKKRRRKNR